MIYHWSEAALGEFFAEALHLFRVQAAELPAAGVAGEDLESITLVSNCCVYCVVEGFSDGDVDPNSNRNASLVQVSPLSGR